MRPCAGPDSSPVQTSLSPSQPGALAVSHSPWLPTAARTKRLDALVEAPQPFDLQARVLLGLLLLVAERLPEVVRLQLSLRGPLDAVFGSDSGLANALPSHFHLPRKTLNVSSSGAGLAAGGVAGAAAVGARWACGGRRGGRAGAGRRRGRRSARRRERGRLRLRAGGRRQHDGDQRDGHRRHCFHAA